MAMKTLVQLGALLRKDGKLVWRDRLVNRMILLPLGYALAFHFILPWADEALAAYFDLSEYYVLIIGYVFVASTPLLAGMALGFLYLDDRDAHTFDALCATPFNQHLYFAQRDGAAMVLSFLLTLACLAIVQWGTNSSPWLVICAALASLNAPVFGLFLACMGQNKIQGIALMKITGTLTLLAGAGYFVPLPWQWIAGVIPVFWCMKLYWLIVEANAAPLAVQAIALFYPLAVYAGLRRLFAHRWIGT